MNRTDLRMAIAGALTQANLNDTNPELFEDTGLLDVLGMDMTAVEVKAGRVLSASNLGKLKEALQTLNDLLLSAEPPIDEPQQESVPEVAAEEELSAGKKPTKKPLMDAPEGLAKPEKEPDPDDPNESDEPDEKPEKPKKPKKSAEELETEEKAAEELEAEQKATEEAEKVSKEAEEAAKAAELAAQEEAQRLEEATQLEREQRALTAKRLELQIALHERELEVLKNG